MTSVRPEDRRKERISAAASARDDLKALSIKSHDTYHPLSPDQFSARARSLAKAFEALAKTVAVLPLRDRLEICEVLYGELHTVSGIVEKGSISDPKLPNAVAGLRRLFAGADLPGGARAREEWSKILASDAIPQLLDAKSSISSAYELEHLMHIGGPAAVEAGIALLKPLLGKDSPIAPDATTGIWAAVRNACTPPTVFKGKQYVRLAGDPFPPAFFDLLESACKNYPESSKARYTFDSLAGNALGTAFEVEGASGERIEAVYRRLTEGVGDTRRAAIANGCFFAMRHAFEGGAPKGSADAYREALNAVVADAAAGMEPHELAETIHRYNAALEPATLETLLSRMEGHFKSGHWGASEARDILIYLGDLGYDRNGYSSHYYEPKPRSGAAAIEAIVSRERWGAQTYDESTVASFKGRFGPLFDQLANLRDGAESQIQQAKERQRAAEEAARDAEPALREARVDAALVQIQASAKLNARYEGLSSALQLLVAGGDLRADGAKQILRNEKVLRELMDPDFDPVSLHRAVEPLWSFDTLAKVTLLAQIEKLA